MIGNHINGAYTAPPCSFTVSRLIKTDEINTIMEGIGSCKHRNQLLSLSVAWLVRLAAHWGTVERRAEQQRFLCENQRKSLVLLWMCLFYTFVLHHAVLIVVIMMIAISAKWPSKLFLFKSGKEQRIQTFLQIFFSTRRHLVWQDTI